MNEPNQPPRAGGKAARRPSARVVGSVVALLVVAAIVGVLIGGAASSLSRRSVVDAPPATVTAPDPSATPEPAAQNGPRPPFARPRGGGPPAAPPSPAVQPPPVQPPAIGRSGASRNWSGYVATGGSFTTVAGTWVVPQVAATSTGVDATWVGIGGVSGHDLIQAGTEAAVESGAVSYDAWIEMLPQGSEPIALAVKAGDSITTTLTEASADVWRITIANNTSGKTYATTVRYASSHSSAEWIEEAPSGMRRVLPLDEFGMVRFSAASSVEDGKSVSLGAVGAKPVTMIDAAGQPLAQPSAIGADGKSFSVTRTPGAATGSGARIPPGRRG